MSDEFLTYTNPATGETFGQVRMHTAEQVQQARQDMGQAFQFWARRPVKDRVYVLGKLQTLIIDSLDEITEVISQDTGKSRQDALIEVMVTVDMLHQYRHSVERWLKRRRVSSGLQLFKACYVEPRPYGVVAVIAPWNYPFALSMPPVLAALLAGNTVLFKPSEVTAATGALIERLFQRVPELAPYVRVLHGDGRVGAALVQAAPDYIFLTGSTPTGKLVAKAAAENLIPMACELGGKDAMIVLSDADLRAAARWGVWGALFNTGQTCMSVERVYVVDSVYAEFVHLALQEMRTLKVGYTNDCFSPYYMGPVSDPRQVKIIQRHLDDAISKGARLLHGGKVDGMFVEPTLLVDVDHSMLLMREETFGPLMPIMRVKNEAEAIRMANDNAYGLGASVWSRDIKHAWRVGRQVEAAAVIINDTITQFAIPMLPFGGIKQSGYGRVHGKEGMMQFTRPYSYVVGNPPPAFDVATIMRSPGNYDLGAAIIRLFFGTSRAQRLQPLTEQAERMPRRARQGLATVLGLAALGGMLAWLGKRR